MRLLVATTHRSVVGGVETYLRSLLPILLGRGFEVGLMCAYPPTPGRPAVDDYVSDIPTWTVSDPAGAAAAAAAWRPDLIYTHELPDPDADAALISRFPTVLYAHNYSGACISGTKCHAAPGWQPCDRPLGRACLSLYFPRRCGGLSPATAVTLYRRNRRRQRLLSTYRSVLVASRHMAAEVERNGVPAERVILNPYFPPHLRPYLDPPSPRPRTDRILFVGRISALKGWRELLDAVPMASSRLGRRLTLVVAGDGPDAAAFEAEAGRRGCPAAFLGWVDSGRREAEMRAADVLAVSSVWPEPFGIVGIEAGCVGLPAVGFSVGGIPDWLTPGVSGELAAGDRPTPDGLAEAIVRTLSNDDHHQRLRVGAWEMAHRFTPESHVDGLVRALESAV